MEALKHMHTADEKEAASVTKARLGARTRKSKPGGKQNVCKSWFERFPLNLPLWHPDFVARSFSLTFSLAWLRVMFARGAFSLQPLVSIMSHSSAPEQRLPSADCLARGQFAHRQEHPLALTILKSSVQASHGVVLQRRPRLWGSHQAVVYFACWHQWPMQCWAKEQLPSCSVRVLRKQQMLPLTLPGTEGTIHQKSSTDVTKPLSRKIQSCLVILGGDSQHSSEHSEVRPHFSQWSRISLWSRIQPVNLRHYPLSVYLGN